MALPKRKVSRARRDKRRTHWKAEAPNLVRCPHCSQLSLPHRVCPHCGKYRGNRVLEVEE
jgi:large subunit ribosomal protein L32